MIDVTRIRADFPILSRKLPNGKPLVYLDNAATTQKPAQVIEALSDYYRSYNSNAHRGLHALSSEATEAYESSRKKAASFVGASAKDAVFTRGTTESINLVAYSWGLSNLRKGDAIVLTQMEHHANLVPWQFVAQQTGATLRFIPITPQGTLDLSSLDSLLENAKLVSVTHASNVLGTINDVPSISRRAHSAGALMMVDAAQSAPHLPVDVTSLGCDFLAFSSHKMLGPMGVGVLWGKRELLESMPPFNYGGEMIRTVSFASSTFAEPPTKFEAGTCSVGDAIAFGVALDYLSAIGLPSIREHEQQLLSLPLESLGSLGATVYGPPDVRARTGGVSFNLPGIHAHDVASILDGDGIAIRSGHHCAMPLHNLLGVPATARASPYLYNTLDEIDYLIASLKKVKAVFARG